MAVNITIKQEAYDALKARKKEGMSYSDVILNLTKSPQKDIMSICGILKEKGIEYDYDALKKLRERLNRHDWN